MFNKYHIMNYWIEHKKGGSLKKSFVLQFLFIILFFLMFLVSCFPDISKNTEPTVSPEMLDEIWMGEKACSLPCWHGIEPGKSSKQETLEKVAKLPFISKEAPSTFHRMNWDIKEKVEFTEELVSFQFIEEYKNSIVMLIFRGDQLTDIDLYPRPQITFLQVAQKFGYPDGYSTQRNTPETKGCGVYLFWTKKKFSIYETEGWFTWYSNPFRRDLCEKIEMAGGKIPSDLSVNLVSIMDDNSLDFFVSTGMQPWVGFSGN